MKQFKLLLVSLLLPVSAWAWQPTKPITVLIGSGPGSAIELTFRTASTLVSESNPDANFIIETKPGADSAVALNSLLNAKPDGYTVAAAAHMSLFVTHDIWQKDMKKYNYNTFVTPFMIAKSPLCIVTTVDNPVSDPASFIAQLKNPSKPINIAIGGGAHKMAYEYMMSKIKGDTVQVQTIRFPGPLQALTAVASKNTDYAIIPVSVANQLYQGKKVKIIALTSDRRLPALKEIPLMKDYVPGMNIYAGALLVLPPDTPKDIVEWYVKNFTKAIKSKEAREIYQENLMFYEEAELTQAGMQNWITKLRETWLPVAENIKE